MVTSMRLTIADLDVLPERWDDRRYEIIDGELPMSTQPEWTLLSREPRSPAECLDEDR
ncbi:MAG TPA: hypothetical protein VGP33_06770 [Chloroflexota bacterium]|jgi:hypothetical protein|nr:hypothetical protein [Chloroflexota bacterium]